MVRFTDCYRCRDRVPPTKDSKGCRSTCEKWKAHEEERNEVYENRKMYSQQSEYVKEREEAIIKRYKRNKVK